MKEQKRHGRRRAEKPKRVNKQMQNMGTILVTGSLLFTVASPALAINEPLNPKTSDDSSQSVIEAASRFLSQLTKNGPITADPNAKLSFTTTAVRSEEGPDTKLKRVLEENAKKDAAKAAEAATKDAEAIAYAAAIVAKSSNSASSGSASVNMPDSEKKAAISTPVEPTKLLSPPLKVMNPTSPFGPRVSPITGAVDEFHRGQDYGAACGTEVMAAAGGTVIYSQWHPYGGGNRVEIDHGNGLITTYNHLSASKVKVGQKVERGDVIALSGTTGASTGCHLHFEVEVNNNVVNPLPWL